MEKKRGGGGGGGETRRRKGTEFLGDGRRRRSGGGQIVEQRSLAAANNRRHVICFHPSSSSSSFRSDLTFPYCFFSFSFLRISDLMMIHGNQTEKSNPLITQQESDLNGSDSNPESDLKFSIWANTKPSNNGPSGPYHELNCFPHSKTDRSRVN